MLALLGLPGVLACGTPPAAQHPSPADGGGAAEGDGGHADSDDGCSGSLSVCNGVCVDTQSATGHCGGCGHACQGGQQCNAGVCSGPANPSAPRFLSLGTNVSQLGPGGMITFSGVLTDPDGIDDLIGGTLLNADGTITYGAFATSGQEGAYSLTLSWEQINTSEPLTFVGSATRSFTSRFFDAAGHEVSQAREVRFVCNTGTGACAGTCYDLQNDEAHCGNCSTACNGASNVCQGGSCRCIAETDAEYCQGRGSACGTSTWTDRCGAQRSVYCGSCAANACCNSHCENLLQDESNCGACGVDVPATGYCNQGVPACNPGETNCSGQCVNTGYDDNNCGQCGRVCPSGSSCNNGACVGEVSRSTWESGLSCNSVCAAAGYSECEDALLTYTDGSYNCSGPDITCVTSIIRNSACNSISVFFKQLQCTCRQP